MPPSWNFFFFLHVLRLYTTFWVMTDTLIFLHFFPSLLKTALYYSRLRFLAAFLGSCFLTQIVDRSLCPDCTSARPDLFHPRFSRDSIFSSILPSEIRGLSRENQKPFFVTQFSIRRFRILPYHERWDYSSVMLNLFPVATALF